MARGGRTGRGAAGAARPQNTISVRAGRGGWGRVRAGAAIYFFALSRDPMLTVFAGITYRSLNKSSSTSSVYSASSLVTSISWFA